MKRGPKRICDCGQCRLCKHRPIGRAHYSRNTEIIKRKSREYYHEHKQEYNPKDSQELSELDRKCLESLKQEGFR